MSAPRPEPIIVADLARLDEEQQEHQTVIETYEAVRTRLTDGFQAAADCALDSGKRWTPPSWAKSKGVTSHGPGRFRDDCHDALEALQALALGAAGDRSPAAMPRLLAVAVEGTGLDIMNAPVWPRDHAIEELEARREQLKAELEERRKGAGPRRPHRLLVGNYGRVEGPKGSPNRIYKKGGIVMLDNFEAASLNERCLRVVLVDEDGNAIEEDSAA